MQVTFQVDVSFFPSRLYSIILYITVISFLQCHIGCHLDFMCDVRN